MVVEDDCLFTGHTGEAGQRPGTVVRTTYDCYWQRHLRLGRRILRARRGERVAVIEKSVHLSPTLQGFTRRSIYMDSGFHYAGSMGRDGLLRHLVQELGIAGALEGAVRTLDTVDHVRFVEPAFDFAFPQGWEALEQRLCSTFPEDCQGIKNLLAQMRALWEQGRAAFLRDCGRSLGALFAGDGCSLQKAIDQCTSNPVLHALLTFHGILYGVLAPEASLLFHSQVVGSYYESACFIEGGGRFWVKTLERALCEAGVELRCGRGVSRIHVDEQGGFAAVELVGGERLTASRAISTVHPKVMLTWCRRRWPTGGDPRVGGHGGRAVRAMPSRLSGNLIWPTIRTGELHRSALESVLCLQLPRMRLPAAASIICPATLADVPATVATASRLRATGTGR
jgi:hypothetical protein